MDEKKLQVPESQDIIQIDTDSVLERAEKLNQQITKLKKFAISHTQPEDWVVFGNTIYLQSTGCERIANILGVSWPRTDQFGNEILTIEKINLKDGHYTYVVQGEFHWYGRRVTITGKAASNRPFFSSRGGELVPADEVDEGNVRQAAWSNFIVNGVMRILGLRGLTKKELAENGINLDQVGKVQFKQNKPKEDLTDHDHEQLQYIDQWLTILASIENGDKGDILQEMTSFKTKEGKEIKGKRDVKDLTKRQIPYVYTNVKKIFATKANEIGTEIYPDINERKSAYKKLSTVQEGNSIEQGHEMIRNMSNKQLTTLFDELWAAKTGRDDDDF